MISDKLKNLFQFIEFLHSNIENFKQYDDVKNEVQYLLGEESRLNPPKNYIDKQRLDIVRRELSEKWEIFDKNTTQKIKSKVDELMPFYLKTRWDNLFNYYSSDINELKESFSLADIPEILKHKNQYLEFRTKTNYHYFLVFFFDDLDKTLRGLFDFFKDSYEDEFNFVSNDILNQPNPQSPYPSIDNTLPLQPTETKTEQEQPTENNFITSTIEDWLFEFKEKMTVQDYQTLVSALLQYFDDGTFPVLTKPIQINGRINKKVFGWALNRIFEANGKGIEKELLLFAKQNISLFAQTQFDENNIRKSNLYKYFTTQT